MALFDLAINNTSNYNGVLAIGGGDQKARMIVLKFNNSLSIQKSYELAASSKIGFPIGVLVGTLGYKDNSTNNYCLFQIETYNSTYEVEYYR